MRHASQHVKKPDAEAERLLAAGVHVRCAVRCYHGRAGLPALYWLGCAALTYVGS